MGDSPEDIVQEATSAAFQGRVAAMEQILGRSIDQESLEDEGLLAQILEESKDQVAAMRSMQGFLRDENGLYIETRQIKSMLKEAVNLSFPAALRRFGYSESGQKGAKSFLAENAFVTAPLSDLEDGLEPSRLYIRRDGSILTQPDEIKQSFTPIPRQEGRAIKYTEMVREVQVTFEMEVDVLALGLKGFKEGDWGEIFVRGERNGLGASRSQSYGQFRTVEFVEINSPTHPPVHPTPVKKKGKANPEDDN